MPNHSPKRSLSKRKPRNETQGDSVIAQYHQVTGSLRSSFPEITTMLEIAEPDLTGFASLLREHWQKALVSNPITPVIPEIFGVP